MSNTGKYNDTAPSLRAVPPLGQPRRPAFSLLSALADRECSKLWCQLPERVDRPAFWDPPQPSQSLPPEAPLCFPPTLTSFAVIESRLQPVDWDQLAPCPGFPAPPHTQSFRQAGRTETVLADTAAACFTEQERPTTPDEMRRFRKSFTGAPGKRIQHWGSENDPPPRPGEFPFGVKNEKGQGVGDMLGGHLEPTPMDAFKLMKAEECYSSAKVCRV